MKKNHGHYFRIIVYGIISVFIGISFIMQIKRKEEMNLPTTYIEVVADNSEILPVHDDIFDS
nr:hypothetical protein [uncultured Blautia sp.]